jgi:hypothetical protein
MDFRLGDHFYAVQNSSRNVSITDSKAGYPGPDSGFIRRLSVEPESVEPGTETLRRYV